MKHRPTPQRSEGLRDLYTHTHSIIHNSQKVEITPNPSMDGRIKTHSMYTLGYYSALKGKEILTPVTTWMNLGDVTLSDISQAQKDKCCVISLL